MEKLLEQMLSEKQVYKSSPSVKNIADEKTRVLVEAALDDFVNTKLTSLVDSSDKKYMKALAEKEIYAGTLKSLKSENAELLETSKKYESYKPIIQQELLKQEREKFGHIIDPDRMKAAKMLANISDTDTDEEKEAKFKKVLEEHASLELGPKATTVIKKKPSAPPMNLNNSVVVPKEQKSDTPLKVEGKTKEIKLNGIDLGSKYSQSDLKI